MVRVIVLSILSFFSLQAQSQGYEQAKFFKLYAIGGGEHWNMKWDSWDKFQSTYNEGWTNVTSHNLTAFEPLTGYIYGAGFRMYVFGVEYTRYNNPDQVQEIVFLNGDKQQFELKMKGYNLNFPIVVPINKWLGLGIDLGLKSLNGELHSRSIYSDGTESYGSEQPFNGVFEFDKRWLTMVGPRIEIGGKVRGFASATWNMMDPGDVTGLKDLGSDYGGVWSGQMKTVYLPEEWNNRKNDYYYFVGNGPLRRELKGMRLQFGLILDIYTVK